MGDTGCHTRCATVRLIFVDHRDPPDLGPYSGLLQVSLGRCLNLDPGDLGNGVAWRGLEGWTWRPFDGGSGTPIDCGHLGNAHGAEAVGLVNGNIVTVSPGFDAFLERP